MSAPPITLSIANCLVARVERNTMYLPMKISSEKQTGIEIVEEGFLDCGATGKFIDQNYTKDKGLKNGTTQGTYQGLQCRWNLEQTRNNPTICGSKH